MPSLAVACCLLPVAPCLLRVLLRTGIFDGLSDI